MRTESGVSNTIPVRISDSFVLRLKLHNQTHNTMAIKVLVNLNFHLRINKIKKGNSAL